jgi:hypothetical protein
MLSQVTLTLALESAAKGRQQKFQLDSRQSGFEALTSAEAGQGD